jgi:hypothetical protein
VLVPVLFAFRAREALSGVAGGLDSPHLLVPG